MRINGWKCFKNQKSNVCTLIDVNSWILWNFHENRLLMMNGEKDQEESNESSENKMCENDGETNDWIGKRKRNQFGRLKRTTEEKSSSNTTKVVWKIIN